MSRMARRLRRMSAARAVSSQPISRLATSASIRSRQWRMTIDPHEGGELRRADRRLPLPRPAGRLVLLQLALGRGDDVVQQLVLRLEMIVERPPCGQVAGLHDVAHRDDRIAALGELGEGCGADRLRQARAPRARRSPAGFSSMMSDGSCACSSRGSRHLGDDRRGEIGRGLDQLVRFWPARTVAERSCRATGHRRPGGR